MNGQSRRLKPIVRRRARDSSGALALPKAMKRRNQNNVEFVELKRTVVKIRQGIIIRKAGIEIEMPSFDASSLKEILRAVNAL